MKIHIRKLLVALAVVAICSLQPSNVVAQGTTAFTYQGQLRDNGTNANGTYTMIFNLYDSATNGNLVAGPISTSPTLVNGLFTVNLDFGNVFNGQPRWLDITVTSGSDTQTLSPRVQVLPAPYAQFASLAAEVTNGAVTTSQLADKAVTDVKIVSVSGSKVTGGVGFATNADFLDGLDSSAFILIDVLTNYALLDDLTNYATVDSLTNLSSVPDMQVFDSSGTFVVPDGVTRISVEVWGGGGGGAGGYYECIPYDQQGDCNPLGVGGGGGGAGGYGKEVFDVTPGQSFSVIVGAGGASDGKGGDSKFGNLISAEGGSPGTVDVAILTGPGGTGGSSSAELNITGGSGVTAGQQASGGDGGAAAVGGLGGRGDYGPALPGAEAGGVPSGGGGGGQSGEATGEPGPGAPGGHGRVVVSY